MRAIVAFLLVCNLGEFGLMWDFKPTMFQCRREAHRAAYYIGATACVCTN